MTKGRTILIVDDEPNLRKLIAQSLLMEGFQVAEAADGLEALKLLRSRTYQPGLILLDLMMPNMGGQDFRKEQLRDSKLSQIPVILMSAGRPSYEIIQEMAPEALVNKPFDLHFFLETVEKLCV